MRRVWILGTLLLLFLAFAPSALAATAVLTWQDNSANETNFDVERKTEECVGSAAPWGVIGSVGANIVTYRDGTIAEGGTYCWRVNGRNAAGKGPYSNTAGVSVPFTIPVAPGQLGVTLEP